jgi:succinate dehydrogenase / fumarate reductase iron-sulfur subunit
MCSNIGACEAECPKEIKLTNIAFMNRAYLKAVFSGGEG